MGEIESVDCLLQRCYCIKGQNEFLTKMHVMELMGQIHRMVEMFKFQIEQLVVRPIMNISTRKYYDDCRRRIADCISCITIQPTHTATLDGNKQSVADWFTFNWEDETGQERAGHMKLVVDTLLSDRFNSVQSWACAVKKALGELLTCVERIANLVDTQWTKQQYELLMDDLEMNYANALSPNGESAQDFYDRWKRSVYEEQDEYPDLISTLVKMLLKTGFIIVDDCHSGYSYKKKKEELSFYVACEETTVEWQKKFAMLCKIAGHKDQRFLFRKSTLGRYVFQHRSLLTDDDLKVFFFFKQVCLLAYADMDMANNTVAANTTEPLKTPDAEKGNQASRQFTSEEVLKSGIVKYADMVLELLEKKRTLEPRIYWYCIYHVLCEKGWIKKNITAFCTGMKELFGVGLDRSAMNAEKKTYEKFRVEEWNEAEERLKRKKAFALQFRAELESCLDRKLKAALNG